MTIPDQDRRRRAGVFFAALIIALGGIIYELIIGTTSSYLLGDGVVQFSLTIGFMLFGMGLGSLFAPRLAGAPETTFVLVETVLGLVGGSAPILLFWIFNRSLPFYPLFILLVLAIGILIGLEIPLMFSLLRRKTDGTWLLSRLLSLDYVGALIASLAFPFILLPKLGLVRAALVIGLSNALIACLMYALFYADIRKKAWVGAAVSLAAAALASELVFANVIARGLEQGVYKDEIVYAAQTPYQRLVLTKFRDDVRLFLNGNLQFSRVDEHRYHEPLVHVPMAAARTRGRILVLGGGDGLAVREILKYPDVDSVTLVDLDRDVTDLARRHPLLLDANGGSLDDPRVDVVNEDAFVFLRETDASYDVIIADLPDPNNESLAKLYAVEFYELAKRRLSKDGAFVTQATSPYFSNGTFWMIDRTLRAAGFHTRPYHAHVPSFGEWGFILATSVSAPGTIELANVPMRILTPEILPTLFLFDPDVRQRSEDDTVNSLIHPVIINLYAREAAQWTGQ